VESDGVPLSELEPLPYYKWWWLDWRANRRVQRMSWQARGLYRELLDEQWKKGSIPSDPQGLAEVCGCTVAEMGRYWLEIAPCFKAREDGRLVNSKMENQRTDTDAKRVRLADAGRIGGRVQAKAKRMLAWP
jgi:hypothetical protein